MEKSFQKPPLLPRGMLGYIFMSFLEKYLPGKIPEEKNLVGIPVRMPGSISGGISGKIIGRIPGVISPEIPGQIFGDVGFLEEPLA